MGEVWRKYGQLKATQDNTKLICFLPKVEGYSGSVLDIGVGETKTINKSDNLMYLFFLTGLFYWRYTNKSV